MRHRVKGRKFGREIKHRKALLNNLVRSLIIHGRITTTLAKAKEMRSLAERLVTYGKNGTIHHRRLARKVVKDGKIVKKLFEEIAPRFTDRTGGYTRVLKKGFRKGDAAPMAIIEFVEGATVKTEDDNIKAEALTK